MGSTGSFVMTGKWSEGVHRVEERDGAREVYCTPLSRFYLKITHFKRYFLDVSVTKYVQKTDNKTLIILHKINSNLRYLNKKIATNTFTRLAPVYSFFLSLVNLSLIESHRV